MPITNQGWELLVTRLGIQKDGSKKRTYGTYQVYRSGNAVDGLSGFMCECLGPGDNAHAGNGKRIEKGRYPLWTQFGHYRTTGYSEDTQTNSKRPMPALLLQATGNRTGILIHPAHRPNLYLSSIGCFNPTGPLAANNLINFWDSRARVIALINDLRNYAPLAFEHEVSTRISDAAVVVEGEPMGAVPAPRQPEIDLARAFAATSAAEPDSLPISKSAALICTRWLMDNFGTELRAAVQGKPYGLKHLCAIVCQETAYKWIKWISMYNPQTIVERCVFDASGDYPGTTRNPFPRDTAAFRAKYGNAFTAMLIEEANITRRMQGYSDKNWVYKGYGIFQYDLQYVETDTAFFKNKSWYKFTNCLDHACKELDTKYAASNRNLWLAIQRYNGSGPDAEKYMRNVKVFANYCAEITGN